MKIAFCVRGIDHEILNRVEFYRQDWLALLALGHEPTLVTTPTQLLAMPFDCAVVWWWNYLWLFGPVLRARRIPVLTVGVFDVDSFAALPIYKQYLKRWGIRFSALNAPLCRYEAERMPRFGVRASTIRVGPLGIDVEALTPPAKPRNLERPILLNIAWQKKGNMERKMLPEMLAAFAAIAPRFPAATMVFAGKPEDGGPILQRMASELGIADRVSFPGVISAEEKRNLLRRCALYCQVSRYEGFGLATAEALACGAPALVSAVGAVPEVVGDAGIYVRDLSIPSIAAAMAQALDNLPRLHTIAKDHVARIRAEFSFERRRRDYAEFLAIAGGSHPGMAGARRALPL